MFFRIRAREIQFKYTNIFVFFNRRGSAIAKIVGVNAKRLPEFDDRVTMYVFEEVLNGKKLTETINETHENIKYLPGHKLPENVVSKLKNLNIPFQ